MLLRVLILAIGVLAVILVRPDALPRDSLLEMWRRWDAPHFLEIARYGYGPPADPARIVLFPLFPLLIAAGSRFGDPLVVAMLIAFASTLFAAAGLYRLVGMDADRGTARTAVLAMSIFPTAFTLVAPYSEATYLAFAIWSFVCARRGDWQGAGVAGLLASATRIQGIALLPALAVEYWLARRRVDRDAIWIALVVGGPLIYLAINLVTFGDPLFFLDIQRTVFHVSTAPPWVVLQGLLTAVANPAPTESWLTIYLAPLVSFVGLAATLIWTVVGAARRASYAVYTGVLFATFAILSWPISVPRYLMAVFPIFIAMAYAARRPWLGGPLLVASTAGLAGCLMLFVIGHWAF